MQPRDVRRIRMRHTPSPDRIRVRCSSALAVRSVSGRWVREATVSDAEGSAADRSDAISVSHGPPPEINRFGSEDIECDGVAAWLLDRSKDGLKPHEFAVLVRSDAQIPRARAAVEKTGFSFVVLDDRVDTVSGKLSISTMPLAKGLEFRAIVVIACDDEVIRKRPVLDICSPPVR